MGKRVYLESLGCKLNQCERDRLARRFATAGFEVVPDAARADLCVLNSCAVTAHAAAKSRRRMRALARANPAARIVVTGCLVDLVGAGGAWPFEPDLVVPNADKDALVALVLAHLGGERAPVGPGTVDQAARPRTRPLVKIQDGCDNACAYCVVHRLRGKQRSRPRDEILAEVRALREQGAREVVLTGVHVGAYGRERGESLVGLLRALLADPPQAGGPRLRLSSIEPWDLTPEFFALWQDPRLCRHLHLPLQSGCDATLARMGRRYTTAQYADWAAQARAAIPGLALTTDLIAGLPGETPDEHAESAAFCRRTQFARTHVFTYSPRPGTPAAEMPDQVPLEARRARARQLKQIGRQSADAFRRRFVGQTLSAVIERRRARGPGVEGWWTGWTDNYLRVYLPSPRALGNTLCAVRLREPLAGGLRAELLCRGASVGARHASPSASTRYWAHNPRGTSGG